MVITLDAQTIITAGAVVTASTVIVTLLVKVIRWVDKQKKQDHDIQELSDRHDSDNNTIQEELQLLTWGVLACLKGLREQGCNGPVTEAIEKIEKEVNKKAHHREERKRHE